MSYAPAYADYCWDPAGRGFRQRDLAVTAAYDRDYLDYYRPIDDKVRALAAARAMLLSACVPARGRLLDFGCGTNRVAEAARGLGWDAWGYDLAPGGGPRVADPFAGPWDAVTLFDVLEHLPGPDAVVRRLDAAYVLVSVPWCHRPHDPVWFMGWKHRKPGEHLWHWGRHSLDLFFHTLGYRPVLHGAPEDAWRPNPDQPEPNILTAAYARR
jgi:hypothetical protein